MTNSLAGLAGARPQRPVLELEDPRRSGTGQDDQEDRIVVVLRERDAGCTQFAQHSRDRVRVANHGDDLATVLALDTAGEPGPVAVGQQIDRQLELVGDGRGRLLRPARVGGLETVHLVAGRNPGNVLTEPAHPRLPSLAEVRVT